MNTRFELSMPGFMNIDFVNQIRKEAKIGGGGSAVIYRGVILDPKLKEVTFPFLFFFFFFSKKITFLTFFFFFLPKRNLISKIFQLKKYLKIKDFQQKRIN